MITNFQLKAKTIQVLEEFVKSSIDISHFNVFIAWTEEFRDGTPPNENANVTTAQIPESLAVLLYDYLLSRPQGLSEAEDLDDFQTSLQSKRNGDPVLDAQCTELETRYANQYTAIKDAGRLLLIGA